MIERVPDPSIRHSLDQIADLRGHLTAAIALADTLENGLIAIKISEALDVLNDMENTSS